MLVSWHQAQQNKQSLRTADLISFSAQPQLRLNLGFFWSGLPKDVPKDSSPSQGRPRIRYYLLLILPEMSVDESFSSAKHANSQEIISSVMFL